MERRDFVLASMAPAGQRSFSPVQIQKLFFLLDGHIAEPTGGPHFRFIPYDYGPFDKDVYLELDRLNQEGLIEILVSNSYRSREYRLTDRGHERGVKALKDLPQEVQNYVGAVVNWVRSLSFAELVSAIYTAYPDMRENSVFRGHS